MVKQLKTCYPFGEDEKGTFKFTGIQQEQVKNGVMLHQHHYINALKEIPIDRDRSNDEPLAWKEQTAYRSLQGAEAWTAIRS